ncbi:hypothetical protein F0562_000558 [Nyssa sinensis]|uniref:SET domain-containing protein n=1 Tax=Nyssa sinensis TaxID=561372 RepID=A0A5J5C204_9ASTE|nr:hypothetical protein F0562_000558 [Nyssa sinensis]
MLRLEYLILVRKEVGYFPVLVSHEERFRGKNMQVAKACKAMNDIGIPKETVKPVLKDLLDLYDKNWKLIEDENYRVLIDAIFDHEDPKRKERKTQEFLLQDEAKECEPPLKRSRMRSQTDHFSDSSGVSIPGSGTSPLRMQYQDAQVSQTCYKQKVAEFTHLCCEDNQTEPKTVSPPEHCRGTVKKPSSPKSRSLQGQTKPSQLFSDDLSKKKNLFSDDMRAECYSLSPETCLKDNGNDPVPLQVFQRGRRLNYETSKCIVSYKEPKVMHCGDLASKENVFDKYHNDDIGIRSEPFDDDLPQFEVPLAIIPPASPTLLCEDGPSNGNCSNFKGNGLELLEFKHLNMEDKGDRDSSQFDIASSSKGEVKISLICNYSQRSDFHVPSLDAILKRVEERYLKLYRISEPGFSLVKLMKDLCEFFLEEGTNSTDDGRARSINVTPSLDVSKQSNALDLLAVRADHQGNFYIPPSISNGSVKFQNLIETSYGGRDKNTKALEGLGSSNSSSMVVVQKHRSSIDPRKPPQYVDDITRAIPCACASETGGEFAYTPGGLVEEKFLENFISISCDPQQHHLFYCKDCPLERSKDKRSSGPCKGHSVRKFIKECWYKCGCSKKCGNRVVQRGITVNLQVFMTPEGKGWGLRTLEDLPKGAFVCEYVGEIVTNMELFERNMRISGNEKHTYPVLLDADWGSEGVLKDEKALCLDATFYGNVARFINHRCFDANLVEIPVEVETPDHHYYHLAYFTRRKVDAFEELTWDYGIDFNDSSHPVKAFQCRCGSKFCRDGKCPMRSRSGSQIFS